MCCCGYPMVLTVLLALCLAIVYSESVAEYQLNLLAEHRELVEAASQLNPTCLNLNCDFFYYFLTCNVFGIHMDKVCASYFVGT